MAARSFEMWEPIKDSVLSLFLPTSSSDSKAELNLVQLRAEEERYKQVQDQNHAGLLQEFITRRKVTYQTKAILAQLENSRGSMKLSLPSLAISKPLELTHLRHGTKNRPRGEGAIRSQQLHLSKLTP